MATLRPAQGRLLLVGGKPPAAPAKPDHDELDALFRATIEAEWTAIRPKVRRAASLRGKLADPALATHSRRGEAEARLETLEMEIEAAMRTIGHQWRLLSAEGCQAMAREGWPDVANDVALTTALLRDIALGEPYRWVVNQGWQAVERPAALTGGAE